MEPITQFSQLDLSKTYSYADYLTWKFDEFVELIRGKVMRPMAGQAGGIRCFRVIFLGLFISS